MAGMHRFTEESGRCLAPGCRAPNEGRLFPETSISMCGAATEGERRPVRTGFSGGPSTVMGRESLERLIVERREMTRR